MSANSLEPGPEYGTFAILEPANDEARALFSESVRDMRMNNEKYYLQFVQETTLEGTTSSGAINSSEYDTDDHHGASIDMIRGHFILSLHREALPEGTKGWRVGKGDSKTKELVVDFLIAPVGSKLRKQLARVHLFFRFNHTSGMLILVAVDMVKPVYIYVNGQWEELKYPRTRVLYQQTNMIKLGSLQYELTYTVPLE